MVDQLKVDQLKVGIIGCGNIAPAYMRGCAQYSDVLDVVACADINPETAARFAEEHDLRAMGVDDLLADDEIQIVINLTVPKVHAQVSQAIIEAGKHAYSEKPLGIDPAQGRKLLDAAAAKNLRVGCAPDTFLGGGLQTCRKLLDDGVIGQPIGAAAFFMGHGPEGWHPNPHFFYQEGAGPVFDLGPYYLTALVSLLGPVARLSGMSRISFPERIATSPQWRGARLPVEVPTHATAALEFASGPLGTAIISFDVWASQVPRIEIYGSEGTLSVSDPNAFGGPVSVWQLNDRHFVRDPKGGWHDGTWQHSGWREVALTHNPAVARGIGVADMAYAIQSGRPHRASGELAQHVLELMDALQHASERDCPVVFENLPAQPAPLPLGLTEGELDT